ncbi:MAG: glucose-6-phosphate isomerase [Pseudomonadota bacterium]|nr:glucose-6-phosphate isomerase [Pseudomonadota bacterium]
MKEFMLDKPSYQKLLRNYQQLNQLTLLDLFAQDNNRALKYTLKVNDMYLDFSKNNITDETVDHLVNLAHESNLIEHIQNMFNGCKINNTESRAVLHTALRTIDNLGDKRQITVDGKDVIPDIQHVLHKMHKFSSKVHTGEHLGHTGKMITDIVNLGIGGSDLGPVLVCQALKPYCKNNLNIHFVSSVDGYQILDILSELNPETTLFIVASKTFTTEETITNAHTARTWFLNNTNNNTEAIKLHFVAASTNTKAVTEFGINAADNMFQFWDFVGGRYSLWSAIGLSIILYIGFDNFKELLAGARAMDEHFLNTHELQHNMPVMLALLGIWYINFYNYSTQVISPYNTRLTRFPAYIQQLEMESNGKSVDKSGKPVSYKTCPVIWGDSGINGQHAYYQLLHQGTSIYPMDIILALSDKYSDKLHNQILQANAIAQAEAFMVGKTHAQAKAELIANGMNDTQADFLAKHKVFAGNRPSNMLILPEISPYYLGNLIALYEHKTFVQGVIWNINSFDQWGVELGKQLARTVLADIKSGKASKHDESTVQIINLCS